MRGFKLMLGLGSLAFLVVAFAQTEGDQAGSQPATATDEWKPASVVTPTSDTEANEAGRPLTPEAPGPRTGPGEIMEPETVAPSEEAVAAEEALLPPEPSRKRWRFTPLFGAGVVYDDNIFSSNTNRVGDVIWTISAGLAFELGDFRGGSENYLSAHWIGIPTYYTENSDQNNFNQAASLFAQYRWARLLGQLQSNFSVARAGNREVNTIATTQAFSNYLRFKYDYSGKTSFDLQVGQSASVVESFENNYQYEGRLGVSYQIFPKTSLGLEAVGGVLDNPSSPLQYYQQGRLRVNYVATGKLNFKLSAGGEAREFQGTGTTKVSPVFSLGLQYQPFDGTTFSVVGYRNIVGSSAVAGQDITATGFEISATQRLFQKFTAGISLGYENDEYFSIDEEEITGDRTDNYIYVRPTLRYSFVRWVSINVFYEYRNNTSTRPTSTFSGSRVGMEVAASF